MVGEGGPLLFWQIIAIGIPVGSTTASATLIKVAASTHRTV
jgi:hypothetical protein